MSAALCQIDKPGLIIQQPSKTSNFARLGVKAGAAWCPHCQSLIYSRRQKFCGVCEKELPGSLVFSERQSLNVKSLLEEEREKHRRWLRKSEARTRLLN
jgi:hypothetical protein